MDPNILSNRRLDTLQVLYVLLSHEENIHGRLIAEQKALERTVANATRDHRERQDSQAEEYYKALKAFIDERANNEATKYDQGLDGIQDLYMAGRERPQPDRHSPR